MNEPILIYVAEFLIVVALWTLGAWILIKRVKSRKQEDGEIRTLLGTKKSK